MNLESIIINKLMSDSRYARTVAPHLKKEYFEGPHKILFTQILKFIQKYNKLPNVDTLKIELNDSNISDDSFSEACSLLNEVSSVQEDVNIEWLLEKTEKWCQDKSVYLAIMESISIIDGKHEKLDKGALPDLLQKALSVSFDNNIGHDYLENASDRFDFYHRPAEKLEFDIELLNEITEGGVERKTLNVILAGPHAGKSLVMCHMASHNLTQGKNVLYITMEMAEEKISERIDANLMNLPISSVKTLERKAFNDKINSIITKTNGKLIVKQFPTGSAHVGHFRALLNDLKLKRKFIPDIIYVDYLNICASSRMKMGGSVNTYSLVKSIAEELRGLAIEYNLPIWSATQTTRGGYSNSDVDMTDVSESFGVSATADFMIAIIANDELKQLNQILIKQLKNRYGDVTYKTRFVVGIDRPKMKLYDVEANAQQITGSTQNDTPPLSTFGTRKLPDFSDIKI